MCVPHSVFYKIDVTIKVSPAAVHFPRNFASQTASFQPGKSSIYLLVKLLNATMLPANTRSYQMLRKTFVSTVQPLSLVFHRLRYSIDIVPTFIVRVSGGKTRYFVAKAPMRAYGHSNHEIQLAWRHSFSMEEKEKFKTMDQDNGCRK